MPFFPFWKEKKIKKTISLASKYFVVVESQGANGNKRNDRVTAKMRSEWVADQQTNRKKSDFQSLPVFGCGVEQQSCRLVVLHNERDEIHKHRFYKFKYIY